jgi:hypothetical protein
MDKKRSSSSRSSSPESEGFGVTYRIQTKKKHHTKTEKPIFLKWITSMMQPQRTRKNSEEKKKRRRKKRSSRHLHQEVEEEEVGEEVETPRTRENRNKWSRQIIESTRYGNMIHQKRDILHAIEKGGDINYQDEKGNTALIYAVKNKEPNNFIHWILELKADPNIMNNDEDTAYLIALREKRQKNISTQSKMLRENLVKLLEDEGAFIPGQEVYLK